MSVKKLRRLPLAAAALVACVGAQAEYQSPDGNFRMSGFGTVGAVKTSTDDAVYVYPGQGGGATKHGSLNPDSKLAVQGTYKINQAFSATGQVMTKYDADGQYVPKPEWAFLKWQAAPSLAIRAGRMGAPLFMISDFRDVGYANTFVRPPLDVYGQVPISNFEGADATYQFPLGPANISATFWAGDSKAEYSSALHSSSLGNVAPVDVTLKRNVGINLQAELDGGWSFRVGRNQGKLTVHSGVGDYLAGVASSLSPRLTQYAGSAAPDAAKASTYNSQIGNAVDLLNPDSVDASFTGLGLAYDQDNWVGSVEYTKRKTKSYISDTTGWYGVIGYRVAKFTPYVGLSKIKSDRRSDNPIVNPSLLGSAALTNGMAAFSNGVAGALSVQKQDEKTASLGIRWDAMSSLAVKAQFDRVRKPADSNGMFLIPDAGVAAAQSFQAEKRSINVVTLSVDFVF